MATRLQRLRNELLSEQRYATWVANKNYQAIVTDINTPRIDRIKVIGSGEFLRWGASGPLAKIMLARDNPDVGIASRAYAASFYFIRENLQLDLSQGSQDRQLLSQLLSDGVFTGSEANALLAIASETVSRAQQLELGRVRVGTVHAALEVING